MNPRTPTRRGGVVCALALLLACLAGGVAAARAEPVDPWLYAYEGLDHFYNLEYDESIAALQKALQAEPDNPILRNFLTNAYLFQELYRLRQLEGNLYSASNAFLKEKPKPDPQRIQMIRRRVAEVKEICEARLDKNPRDTEALYALGLAYGIEANYTFTLDKRYLDALRLGYKANELHERLLKIDPNYHDAALIPGLYEYAVGSIPRSVKWLAFIFGYRGSKEEGLRLLQEAMTQGKWVSSDAAILLAVIYTREGQHAYARQLLTKISEYFPRNPLFYMEVGRSFEREGKTQEALTVYLEAARHREAGAPGYQKIPRERLYYEIGSLHQRLGEFDKALAAYAEVSERADSDGLLRAYSGLRRGEIFLAQRHRELARAEYERVAALPYEEPRRQAEERLRVLNRRGS